MRVLFFTPYFGRTGSEMCLFDLLMQAKNQYFETGICVLRGKGELLQSLSFPVASYNYQNFRHEKIEQHRAANTKSARVAKILNPLYWLSHSRHKDDRYDLEAFIEQTIHQYQPDICYVNTLLLHQVVTILGDNKVKNVILHAHESSDMLNGLTTTQFNNVLDNVKLIITPSEQNLNMFGRMGRKTGIKVFHSPVDFGRVVLDEKRIDELKAAHHIAKENFIWTMSGTIDPNKDAITFVELAKLVSTIDPSAFFMWLGKGETAYAGYCKALAQSYGLKNKLLWVEPANKDYYNYLEMCNAFVLTSRQDTFPLVVLEAAFLKKPIVSFDSGGVTEFLGDDHKHLVIKSRSLEEMAALMHKVMHGGVNINTAELRLRAEKNSAAGNYNDWVKMITNQL